jgi:hypothetical protein
LIHGAIDNMIQDITLILHEFLAPPELSRPGSSGRCTNAK